MIRFILADLNRFRLGAFFIAAIVALAVALGVAVTLQERPLRLGSARAAEKVRPHRRSCRVGNATRPLLRLPAALWRCR